MESLSAFAIFTGILYQFLPVWIALAIILIGCGIFRSKLGLVGKLYDNPIGIIGFAIVVFWILTALMADLVVPFDPYEQVLGMKNKAPGFPVTGQEGKYFLLGGDNLARDVFSRMVAGSQTVLSIAPAATLFAFMVGITLGLPAGYYMGRIDTGLSFLANMVLAFPVILL
ncbi:MAG: ABC transporter permease, partial [Pseudomonadota bacterium]